MNVVTPPSTSSNASRNATPLANAPTASGAAQQPAHESAHELAQQPPKGLLARTLAPEALDFAPDLLAIQERPPGRIPRVMLRTVAVLIGLLVLWAIFGKLDIVASAEGRLVPATYTKIVQPADAGIVQDILVAEGQAVQAGQVLMRMDAKLAQADLATLGNESALKTLTLRRIDAELANQPFLQKQADPPVLYAEILAQYTAKRRAYMDAVNQETEVLNKARQDLLAAQQIQTKLLATLPIIEEQAKAQDDLASKGFFSPLAAKDKLREKLEKEQDLKAQQATVASLRAVIAQSEQKLKAIKSNYDSQLQTERVQASGEAAKLAQELGKQAYKSSLLELRAPVAGTVKDLATHTRGAVVSPGTILMTVVPKDEPLLAEVQVRNEDVGFVATGQSVKVKLSAYPFQKFGMLEGTVKTVSADSNLAQNDPQQVQKMGTADTQLPLTYKAMVALDKQHLFAQASQETLKLSAGMQVVAEIHQGRRTVFEYLTSPVQKIGKEAGRER
jgi:hemolysin D